MTKLVSLFFLVNIFLSCQEQADNKHQPPSINGDWIGPTDTTNRMTNQTGYISFQDSLCWSFYWADSKYRFQKDTLVLTCTECHDTANRISKYIIKQLTIDSLVLTSVKHIEDIPDTLKFSKTRVQNNITPSAIYVASSVCFGRCPIMNLEIDSNLQVKFFGESWTSVEGGYSGRINRDEYNSILNQVRSLPLDALRPFYRAPWTDDQTREVMLQVGDSLIYTSAYGHYREPMELYLLSTRLMGVYEHISLYRDTLVNEEYFSTHPAKQPSPDLILWNKPNTP